MGTVSDPRSRAADGAKAATLERASWDRQLDSRRLAHRINNPLAVLTTNLDFALARLRARPDRDLELEEALDESRTAAERIGAVVAGSAAFASAPVRKPVSPAAALGSGPRTAVTRILVVDPDPSVAPALNRDLAGSEITSIVTCTEAWERISNGDRYTFVVCDLRAPGMPAQDLYSAVERLSPEQADAMIFTTSGGPATPKESAFVASVPNLVLSKPVDPRQLLEFMRSHAGRDL